MQVLTQSSNLLSVIAAMCFFAFMIFWGVICNQALKDLDQLHLCVLPRKKRHFFR